MWSFKYFAIPKHLNFFSPITFISLSSQMAYCLFEGSCKLFSLIYAHNCFTTSCLGALLVPTTAAKSVDNCKSFVNPVGFPILFGAGSESSELTSDPDSLRYFCFRFPCPLFLLPFFLPHSSPDDSDSDSSDADAKPLRRFL